MKLLGEIYQVTALAVLFRPAGGRKNWLAFSWMERRLEAPPGTPRSSLEAQRLALPAAAAIYVPTRVQREKFGCTARAGKSSSG